MQPCSLVNLLGIIMVSIDQHIPPKLTILVVSAKLQKDKALMFITCIL